MDENQQRTVLLSIAVSSGFLRPTTSDPQAAFLVLEDFKAYDGHIGICIEWLQRERHVLDGTDITVPVKLYTLTVIDSFLQTSYGSLSPNEQVTLRLAVLTAARQIAPVPISNEGRILGNKIALVLASLMVRDFPQRWTTFFPDTFSPMQNGGLWSHERGDGLHIMGVKICLECLRLVTEDTTDSDFNAKISTSRRNDILIGLNEVSSQFLPLLFVILEHYSFLLQTKTTLHNMRSYLLSNNRLLSQMTPEEKTMYEAEANRKEMASTLINDCLETLSRFCHSMPMDWMWGATPDFIAAFMHLLREPTVQLNAVACLDQIALRKLDSQQWMRLIRQIPPAIADANQVINANIEELDLKKKLGGSIDTTDALALEVPYHRALSRMLSSLISTNVSHITTDKGFLNEKGEKSESLSVFLRLLVELIRHPSGRVASEQLNMWIMLLRDPQISKTNLLAPFAEDLMTVYMNHLVRIRWEDIDERSHPLTSVVEASWDDEDEYDAWIGEYRSKCSQFFKFVGNVEPEIAANVLKARTEHLLTRYGSGLPGDRLHRGNNQLTQKSEAIMQLEGLIQPLDTTLSGLPLWSLEDDGHAERTNQARIRSAVRGALAQVSSAIVSWNPNHLFLKFRRAQLFESLKNFWVHDPTNLLQAIDSLLGYLSAPDDWNPGGNSLSAEVISLRKKSGVALVTVAKRVPHHLVPWLSQLSEAVRKHLSSGALLAPNRMNLYEFLSCVATAVNDPVGRATFISDVLSDAISVIESAEFKEKTASTESLIMWLGIAEAATSPQSVTNPENVQKITSSFERVFSAINQILSVGKRCNEAARMKKGGGVPLQTLLPTNGFSTGLNFPDEGPVSLQDLAMNDPFVPLWTRILPPLLQILDVTLRLWHPEHQAILLRNSLQRYALAISDDEAFLSKVHDAKTGGVFGEGGTAGSVVAGADRRHQNLVPRWSGWFNELRNTCFQMLGLLSGQRALFAPELRELFPRFVAIVANPDHIRSMENRHFTQFLKQFVEILLLGCPSTLYLTHVAPIVRPLFEHIEYRLQKNWDPVLNPSAESFSRPLTSSDCIAATALAARGGEEWFTAFYGRGGLFVGDLDMTTAEAAVEKSRVEVSRTFSDTLQAALALKGDWALVLANQAREEAASKKNDPSLLTTGPKTRPFDGNEVNADGTPKRASQTAIEARKLLRISRLCHFLMLEDEYIAGHLALSVIQCLSYPDAYTVRRCTKICHRILEAVAWSPKYTPLIANRMFAASVTNLVTEPKWMVGVEWDMINLVRDIYCRLVLGQVLQPGGQGVAVQQDKDPSNPQRFEQSKHADEPLKGGGILVAPSNLPRELLASLPGIGPEAVTKLEEDMKRKRSAKDQKDLLRDLLRIAAENSHYLDKMRVQNGIFVRADIQESLLNQKNAATAAVPDIPEKLVTHSMMKKRENQDEDPPPMMGLGAFQLF